MTNRDSLSAATAEYSLVHGQNEGALKSTRHQTHASVPEELWAPDTLEGLLLFHLRYAVHVHDFTTDPPIPTKICLSTFYNTTVNRHLFEKRPYIGTNPVFHLKFFICKLDIFLLDDLNTFKTEGIQVKYAWYGTV